MGKIRIEKRSRFWIMIAPDNTIASDERWFVTVINLERTIAHGPFKQWEAGQFAATVTPDTPVATDEELAE